MSESKDIAKYAHKVIRREGDLVYKEFDGTYPKANVFNEALNQVRIEETDLNIPHVLDVRQEDGKWTIVMEFIDGETLDERIQKDPDHIGDYMKQLAHLHADLHRHHAPPLLNRLRDKMRRKLESPELNINPSVRYELQTRLDSMPRHSKLIHGDFEPRNIIFGTDGKVYLIDWSHAATGNASADAAKTYMVLQLKHGKDAADIYLNEFSLVSDIPKQLIQQWMPIMAASHLLRTNERHKDFLMSWLDVVDYE